MLERGDIAHQGDHRDVLETFRMFAHDQGWLRRMREAVRTGLTAEAAVERVQSDSRARLIRSDRPLSARAPARSRRLGEPPSAPAGRARPRDGARQPADNAILVARMMGPAALLDYDRRRLRGWCWRKAARRATSRSWRAPSRSRSSARSRTPPPWSRPATPSSSTATPATSRSVPPPRHRVGLRRQGPVQGAPTGAVPAAARPAVPHPRRSGHLAPAERRAPGRSAAPRRDGGGGASACSGPSSSS